jgi:peptidoglycan/xylan/chitin deacetylase (PgdA/CDA1 family)
MNLKTLAFGCVEMSGAACLMRPFFQGRGAILTLHSVLPAHEPARQPGNVVRVEQLREALQYLRRGGWEFVSLDEIPERLRRNGRRFVAVTLDDGYADNLVYGLPVFREFNVPFTVFPVTGFLNRTRLCWPFLIAALFDSGRIVLKHPARGALELPCVTEKEKVAAIARISSSGWTQEEIEYGVIDLCERSGRDATELLDRAFLSWDQLRTLAQDPLASVGVHTVSHRALATLADDEAAREICDAREELESKLAVPVRHLVYPFGVPGTCGEREFRMAQRMGFTTGCTARRGNLHARHASALWSLPRHVLCMLPHCASLRYLRVSLSGVWDSPLNGAFITR